LFRLLLSSADLGGTFFNLRRRGGEKSGKCSVLFKRSVFPTATSGGDLQRLVLIVLAAGQHSRGDASQLVGDRDKDLITRLGR